MFKDSIKKSASKAIKALASDYRLRIILTRLNDYKNISENFLIHPKFNVMKEIIINNLLKNKDSKILVFVKFRNSVQNIMNKLKNIPLIRPARFVGQATKNNEDKGLTQNMQLKILNGFKSGKYNVLISTNVGEEGLDIAECDIVIFYDVLTSEIRYIQRKGRTARQRSGKVFILYSKNTRDEVYLKILDNKTKKMFINLKNKKLINNTEEKNTQTHKVRINLETFIDERKKENKITVNENLVIISNDFPNKLMLESFFRKHKFQVKISGKGAMIKIHDRHIIKLLTPALNDIRNFLNNLKNEINQLLTIRESLILLLDISRNKGYIEVEKILRMFIQDNFSSNKIKFFTINILAELKFILERLLFTFK
ncbi:MAG: helicase-related protein [Promethearchaeota archaeon]